MVEDSTLLQFHQKVGILLRMKKLVIFDWGRTLFNPETSKLFPDTVEVLECLSQKYTLAIVALATAGEEKIQERLQFIKENDLERYFASILFDVSDKDSLYVKTLKDLNITSEETVIIDDRVLRGVDWGNKNGATTVWFQNGKFANELPNNNTGEPDYIVHSLLEIKDIKF